MKTVYLLFRATRTREYTHTYLDLVNDMFVPRTSLAAVCLTPEVAEAEGGRLVDELIHEQEHPHLLDHYQLHYSFRVWEENIIKAWHDAIHNFQCYLEGVELDDGVVPPATVWVVLQQENYRAWGGQPYETYRPHRVFADKQEARRVRLKLLTELYARLKQGPLPTIEPYVTIYEVVEMPLIVKARPRRRPRRSKVS